MPYFANGTQISEEELRMLLVVDVGNTNIVAGVFEDKTLKVHWRFSTDRSKTADEFGIISCLYGDSRFCHRVVGAAPY